MSLIFILKFVASHSVAKHSENFPVFLPSSDSLLLPLSAADCPTIGLNLVKIEIEFYTRIH